LLAGKRPDNIMALSFRQPAAIWENATMENLSTNQPAIIEQDAIHRLREEMRQMPQAPAFKTTHFFAGGMYCRRMEIPAGSLIVSKVHKTEHHFIGCSGELVIAGQGETFTLKPGDVIVSPIGTRRAVFAQTDVVCITVHKTDLVSTDGLEESLMMADEASLYDVNNAPLPGVIVCEPRKELEH
jgi:quercetin dioxygenase-like cupin family protein